MVFLINFALSPQHVGTGHSILIFTELNASDLDLYPIILHTRFDTIDLKPLHIILVTSICVVLL